MKRISIYIAALFLALTSPVLAGASPSPNQIDIKECMYSPDTLKVTAGTKVTWINRDDVPHTIVDSATPKMFHSAALDTNDGYSFAFVKPGTYHYFCTLHPQMVGTIIVAATP